MGVELFVVLPASGGYVNGVEVAIDALVPLSEAEARYEIDAGTVARAGQVPALPAIPAVLPTDLVPTLRGGLPRLVPMASLETYLAEEGGILSRELAERGDAIGAYLVALAEGHAADVRAALAGMITGLKLGEAATMSVADVVAAVRADLTGKEF